MVFLDSPELSRAVNKNRYLRRDSDRLYKSKHDNGHREIAGYCDGMDRIVIIYK
jgi:hypothetical protein